MTKKSQKPSKQSKDAAPSQAEFDPITNPINKPWSDSSVALKDFKSSKKGPSGTVISILWTCDIFIILTAITYIMAISYCPGTGITQISCTAKWILGMPPVYLLVGVIIGVILGQKMSSPTTNQKSILLRIAYFILILLTTTVILFITFLFVIAPILSLF